MDAAVLNPQLMTDVNGNSNAVNAELEVKKLQELVRKLERQNEELRTRANGCTGSPHILPPSPAYIAGSYCIPSPLPTLLCQSSLGSFSSLDEPFEYFHPHSAAVDATLEAEANYTEPTVLDEVNILDVDSLFKEESEDTWLYVSAKARLRGESSVTPLQWTRQVLDSPRAELEAARRSLCLRLDQVHRWPGVLPRPSSPALTLRRVAGVSPLSTSSPRSCSTPHPADQPASSSPLHPVHHLSLTPVEKVERIPTFLPANHSANRNRSLRRSLLSPQSSVDGELNVSELEDDSITQGYKLQDLVDVQVMARLQEESLRQDYAATPTSVNRRSASFSFLSLQRSGEADLEEEEEEEEYGQLPPPQPRLTRVGATLQRGLSHSHTFSSMRDWRRSTVSLASPSSPQYLSGALSYQSPAPPPAQASPALSTYTPDHQAFRPGSDEYDNKLRRSMPNLFRAPSMPSVPSPLSPASQISSTSTLRNSLSFDSSNGLASRLQSSIPSPGQLQNRVQSVGNFQSLSRQPLKATAYVSPTMKGPVSMPTSNSLQSLNSVTGIPHPSKPAGGVTPTPPRSSLPRPASFIGTSSTTRSKIAQPTRSLLTPPKSLSTLSALRDGSWKDGCY